MLRFAEGAIRGSFRGLNELMSFLARGKEGRNDLTYSGNTSRRKETRVMKNLIPWILKCKATARLILSR